MYFIFFSSYAASRAFTLFDLRAHRGVVYSLLDVGREIRHLEHLANLCERLTRRAEQLGNPPAPLITGFLFSRSTPILLTRRGRASDHQRRAYEACRTHGFLPHCVVEWSV